jgi:hypothetical protein
MTRRSRSLAVVVAALLAGCGGTSDSGQPAAPRAIEIPDVTVRNVATGAEVALRDVVPADRPTLVWFWAPH